MDIDLVVAAEISERISEQQDTNSPAASSRKATKAVARRNQRRAVLDQEGLGQALKDTFGNMGDD